MIERRASVVRPQRGVEESGRKGRISPEIRHLLPVVVPVVLAGVAVVAAALTRTVTDPPSLVAAAGILALLAAALFSEAFPVPVENLPGGRLSLSAVFILGAAVLYGPAAAVAVAVLTRVTLEIVERRPRIKLYYNGAVFALAAAAASFAMTPFDGSEAASRLLLEVVAGATAFTAVDILLIAAILSRWSREPFLPLLRSALLSTGATFAIMGSVSLALVVLWSQHPALALVLAGPLVAVALHQRATHNALRAMRLALTDPLTGLGNHRHFQEQLQLQLEAASASRTPLTVCLFDLDDFKQINDRYGHPMGDRVLAHVASRLRGMGEAYRLGGDEFAVVFPREHADVAAATAEDLLKRLAEERWEHGGPLYLSAGIATYPDHSNDRNALVRVADIALYWAKGEGKNRVCVYRPDMPAVTQLRRLTRAPDRAARLQAAAALATAVDARDAFEGSHSTRVGDLAAGIAARLRLPEEILRKPGPLTRREREVLESHPQVGHGMLLPLDIEPVPTWVLHHHERWDGTGVPSRLAGERIPLGARIILVADAWDAMTNARPYSAAQSFAQAREELVRCSGKQFDPVVVDALLEELAEQTKQQRPRLTVVA